MYLADVVGNCQGLEGPDPFYGRQLHLLHIFFTSSSRPFHILFTSSSRFLQEKEEEKEEEEEA